MDDIIKTDKQLADTATELLDADIEQVVKLHVAIQEKYKARPNTAKNLEALRDEYLTRMAEIGILASIDPTPALFGKEPIVDIVGKVGVAPDEPFDHEQKQFEVIKSRDRNEDYYGQHEARNPKSKAAKKK